MLNFQAFNSSCDDCLHKLLIWKFLVSQVECDLFTFRKVIKKGCHQHFLELCIFKCCAFYHFQSDKCILVGDERMRLLVQTSQTEYFQSKTIYIIPRKSCKNSQQIMRTKMLFDLFVFNYGCKTSHYALVSCSKNKLFKI